MGYTGYQIGHLSDTYDWLLTYTMYITADACAYIWIPTITIHIRADFLSKLTVGNNGQFLVKEYTELDISFLGLKVLKAWVLIVQDPNQFLDKKHQIMLPGIIG